MSENREEQRVVDLIREHYGPADVDADAFTGGVHARIQRRRTRRMGVIATVFLLAGAIGLYVNQVEVPPPAPDGGVAPPAVEMTAAVEPIDEEFEEGMEDWWSEETYQASRDEAYPEEYQALAALLVDPLYEEDWE